MSTQVFTLPLNATLSANDHLTVLPTQVVGARDKEVWAVVPAAALSWHWVNLPSGLQKQNNRLLPALQGLMEEMLLDEPEAVHLALQPGWQSGAPAWVAVCNKAWLRQHLHQLQSSGHMVHRIVPEWAPAPFTLPHAPQAWVSGIPEDAWLWVSDAQGAWRLPLQAGFKLWAERLSALSNDDAAAFTQLLIQAEPAVSELAQKSLQTLQSNLLNHHHQSFVVSSSIMFAVFYWAKLSASEVRLCVPYVVVICRSEFVCLLNPC
jgi:general secretion pathway protein L